MGIEDRIEKLEKGLGATEQDKEIINFNLLILVGIEEIKSGHFKSQMSIEDLRALEKPYPKDCSSESELTLEQRDLIRSVFNGGTPAIETFWRKHSGLGWPFEKND